MLFKVADAIGAQLDWMVAKCEGKVEAGVTNMVFFNYPAKAKTS